jgi:hypothetical protein
MARFRPVVTEDLEMRLDVVMSRDSRVVDRKELWL